MGALFSSLPSYIQEYILATMKDGDDDDLSDTKITQVLYSNPALITAALPFINQDRPYRAPRFYNFTNPPNIEAMEFTPKPTPEETSVAEDKPQKHYFELD